MVDIVNMCGAASNLCRCSSTCCGTIKESGFGRPTLLIRRSRVLKPAPATPLNSSRASDLDASACVVSGRPERGFPCSSMARGEPIPASDSRVCLARLTWATTPRTDKPDANVHELPQPDRRRSWREETQGLVIPASHVFGGPVRLPDDRGKKEEPFPTRRERRSVSQQ